MIAPERDGGKGLAVPPTGAHCRRRSCQSASAAPDSLATGAAFLTAEVTDSLGES